MFAVIRTGGKQYRVAAEETIEIEKLPAEVGETVVFDEVLMLGGETPAVGAPTVAGAAVAGEVVEQKRGRKIIVFKKRRRQNSRRKNGHRQHFTVVRITDILTNGERPRPRAVAPGPDVEASAPEAAAGVAAGIAAARAPAPDVAGAEALASGPIDDDVSRIGGIGAKLKEKLAEAGVTSLRQIAEMDEAAVADLDERLKLRGRIAREAWVEQARDLLAGRPARVKADRGADKTGE